MSAPRMLGDDYHFPGLAHFAYPVSNAIRRDLGLDRFGYKPGAAIDTVALDADGAHLTIGPDRLSGDGLPEADAHAYPGFRAQYLEFAKALRPLFENKPPRLKDMEFPDKANLAKLGWKLRFGLGRDNMYEFLRVAAINIYDVLDDIFDDDRLKGAIAADAVLGNAMGPRTPGTVLSWLQHIQGELNGPLSLQAGARSRLVTALAQSAEDAGVEIRLNARVHEILVENDRAFGVRLEDGQLVKANIIVSNADPRSTLSALVSAAKLDAMFANRVSQIRGSGVVAKLNVALSGLPGFSGLDESLLGNRVLVSPTMKYVECAFNHSKYGEISEQPVLDIAIPSVHDTSLAPDGHHVMSINVSYVPCGGDVGWTEEKTALAYRIISQLGQYSPDLTSLIVDHELLTPNDIEHEFQAVNGHWHHGELSIHQSFMMRPLYGAAQYDTPVTGLYLCGAGCHPGGGLTGLPGRNAAKRVLEIGGAS
jgi:phytoene dehydrogenase-like protein